MKYFDWIFDDKSPNTVPASILEKLEKAKNLRLSRDKHRKDAC